MAKMALFQSESAIIIIIIIMGCCQANRQTGHINHWLTQRIRISVSAVVNIPTKGKCGRWLSSIPLTPIRRRCSHTSSVPVALLCTSIPSCCTTAFSRSLPVDGSATSAQHVRPSGIRCRWPDDLQRSAR